MKRKREIIVQKHESGQELFKWLGNRYTYHTISEWEELIKNGNVLVNNFNIKPNHLIQHNDLVQYTTRDIIEPPVDANYRVIYEDTNLLVINKPCDLPCHPGGIYFENTLWYLLKQKYEYFALVNRLDRETSGVMLVAKTKESAQFYFNTMMERKIDKVYLVIVHGILNEKIDAKGFLINDTNSKIRKKRKFVYTQEPEGDYAHTIIEPVKHENNLTLCKVNLLTGKTHQIRATLCSLGFPVLGDKIYGLNEDYFFNFINDELTTDDWDKLGLKNQALHSYKTTLPLLNGETKSFIGDIPENWPIKY